jgi:hypothetical protein
MSIGNGAPAWPSVIVSNGGISPSDHNMQGRAAFSHRALVCWGRDWGRGRTRDRDHRLTSLGAGTSRAL